jgi:ATP-dependent DNA helicase RecG
LKAAMEEYERLGHEVFPKFKLGLLHGRLSSEEKDDVMQRFRKNEVNILVSTTVVEVGVDVPNASVMVIEHAERFGLSQLHQLRGRIGRGAAKSHCVLVGPTRMTEEAKARLEAMVRTSNGFEIAETDLELRGPGEFFGTRQSGSLGFQIANPMRDRAVLDLARQEAFALVEAATPSVTSTGAGSSAGGEGAKTVASSGAGPAVNAGVNELDRLLRRLPAEWQRRYHLARIG